MRNVYSLKDQSVLRRENLFRNRVVGSSLTKHLEDMGEKKFAVVWERKDRRGASRFIVVPRVPGRLTRCKRTQILFGARG